MISEALRENGPVLSLREFVQSRFPGKEIVFDRQIILAFAGDLDGPACVRDQLDRLVDLPGLLEHLVHRLRTPLHQALTPLELARPLAARLKRPFREALARRIQSRELPETIGCVVVRDEPRLFLWVDVGVGRTATPVSEAAFDAAFAQLDQARGGYNLVSLRPLRETLAWPRSDFDALLRDLRHRGRYTLSAAEGRAKHDEEDRAAGVNEEGTLLLYVARCGS